MGTLAKRGRPSKLKDVDLKSVENMCWLGATNAQLAERLGVGETTIDRWIKDDEGFRGTVLKTRAIADSRTVKSLYQRANGYSLPETKVFFHDGQIVEHTVMKHFPPSEKALEFWLKNRQPDDWRDKKEVEISGSVNHELNAVDVWKSEANQVIDIESESH